MHAFYSHFYSENAILQRDPTANILDMYNMLHYIHYSAIAFLTKLFKNFKEQIKSFLNATGDSLVKILCHPALIHQSH